MQPTFSELTKKQLFLLACAVAATAANLYYTQPILPLIGESLGVKESALGAIPALAQIGYAIAIIFISPLGEVVVRRKIIALLSVLLFVGASIASVSSHIMMLGVACVLIGLSANITQQIIPLVGSMMRGDKKGPAIATVMTGLTVGILLSRTISGTIATHFGWRAVFIMSALLAGLVGLMLYLILPNQKPNLSMSYTALLKSLLQLFKKYKTLRKATYTGMIWFAAFNALWATLALHVSEAPFYFNAQQAGMFGIVALAGVAGAKLAGKWVNQLGAAKSVSYSILIIVSGFALSVFTQNMLWGLVASILLIDFGVFSAQVANQVRVFSIDAQAQSRVNSIYMLGYYIGGAIGSSTGVTLYSLFGWSGVSAIACGALVAGLIINRAN
ncbi:MFS transporter [Alteromonas portus]|uniref:MFS transporter n=1 Tax=Alteromonas portus TaxID=2565549 RepID=UPI003BF7ED0A